MKTANEDIFHLLQRLRACAEPFVVRQRGAPVRWDDEGVHDRAYRRDPELYALAALADRVAAPQRARVLYQVLRRSRAGMPVPVGRVLDRVASRLLRAIHPDLALAVFLALRRSRANHKHARRAVLEYLLRFPHLEALARHRRHAVADCLEHAMGWNVARGCAKALTGGMPVGRQLAYVRRNLLRYAADPQRVAAVVPYLFGLAPAPLGGDAAYDAFFQEETVLRERPRTITATNRGDVAAVLVHMYRGGDSPELRAALEGYVAAAAARLPRFDGPAALVLDASASTRGYGEREFACVAQSQALRLVMERCFPGLDVRVVGGAGDPPIPAGGTNLAGAVLNVLEAAPEFVAVVSDGFENVAEGDLGRVVASLPRAGIETPVVFCHSMFSAKDDLSLRRPCAGAEGAAEIEFWHEDDFSDVVWMLLARAGRGRAEAAVRAHLLARLDAAEEGGWS